MERNVGGRPHKPGVTEALLLVAERMMENEGFDRVTVDRLVSEIGTTRPTFYRRYPSVSALAIDVLTRRFGTGTPMDTGLLEQDLLTLQREDIAMFSSPLILNNLPALMAAMRTDPEIRERFRNELLEPRRANVRGLLLTAADRGEISTSRLDVEYICELLMGPLLSRALLPLDGPLDDSLARETVQTVMDHVRGPVAQSEKAVSSRSSTLH